jgi:hypothetical protein
MDASKGHWGNRAAAIAAALLFHPGSYVLFGYALPYSSLPSFFHLPVSVMMNFSFLLFLLWPGVILAGFVLAAYKTEKKQFDGWFVTAVACLLISLTGIPYLILGKGYDPRKEGVRKIQKRGDVIIAALERFRKDTGSYPDRLDALVPKYLPEIPSTGAVAYPKFMYSRDLYKPEKMEPATYFSLKVDTGVATNFDFIIYVPDRNYRPAMGGRVERIGDWAYIHE